MLILFSCVILYFVIGFLVSFFYLRWYVREKIIPSYKAKFNELVFLTFIFPITIIVFIFEYSQYGYLTSYIMKLINKDDI